MGKGSESWPQGASEGAAVEPGALLGGRVAQGHFCTAPVPSPSPGRAFCRVRPCKSARQGASGAFTVGTRSPMLSLCFPLLLLLLLLLLLGWLLLLALLVWARSVLLGEKSARQSTVWCEWPWDTSVTRPAEGRSGGIGGTGRIGGRGAPQSDGALVLHRELAVP